MENSAVFAVSMFQYIGMALVFAKGEPFRQNRSRNCILLVAFMLIIALALVSLCKPVI